MTRKIKWGIISTAKIAETDIIPAIKKSNNSELVAIASRNKDKARKFSKKNKVNKFYSSYKKLYEDETIDVIYNPLPNHLHVNSTINAINNNKHVLLEKPITLKSKDVNLIKKAANKKNKIVKEAFMVRHHSQWQWVKKYVDSKNVGKINGITTLFSYKNLDPKNIRNIKKFGGGGLWDIGCYAIVISRYLMGKEPKRVVAEANFDKNFKTDNLATAILDFGGVYSNFIVSTCSTVSQQVLILGSKKTICIENPFNAKSEKDTTIVIYNGNSIYRKENSVKVFPKVDQYERQVTNFSNHILKNTPIDFDLNDAQKNIKVIESIFSSIRTKKWVRI